MRNIILITSSLLLVTQVFAKGIYVGVDLGSTGLKEEVTSKVYNESNTERGGSQGLKIGYYYSENSRSYASFRNVNAEGDDELTMFGVGYDYLFGSTAFKPFIGALIEQGSYKIDDPNLNISGLIYSVQAGLNYEFGSSSSLELGYKFGKSNMKDSKTIVDVDVEAKVNSVNTFYIGYNYKF